MRRYLSGLAVAFLIIGFVTAASVVAMSAAKGRAFRLWTIVDVWLFFGLIAVSVLGLVVGPATLLLRRWLGPRLTVAKAAAAGALAGPFIILPVWLLTRESYETFGGLLAFWWRLPLEFVIGALPYMAASALFAGWLVAGQRRRPGGRRLARTP